MMTSIPRPNNATPQPLQVKPPIYPRMPFSSPMGEEVLSPTSETSHTPPQEHKENTSKKEHGRNMQHLQEQGKEMLGQKRSSIQEPTKGVCGTNRNESPSRSKWPGLNVITDFSKGLDGVTNFPKPKFPAQRAGNEGPRQEGVDSQRHDRKGNTQGYPTPSPDPRNGHQRFGKSLKTSGSKGRLDDLRRASSKSSNLSPSDRAVVIGISISPEDISQHDIRPGVDRSLGSDHNGLERRLSISPSVAPSIVITPANENAPWSTSEINETSPPHRRAASSVYSQIPVLRNRVISSSIVPPVPPLPPDAQEKGPLPEIEHNGNKDRPPTTTSPCTVFDEEPSSEASTHSRPPSLESQLQILKKSASLDTIATKHRSQGWWNVLISPFFPKSPMSLRFQHLSPEEDIPPVPPTPTKALKPSNDLETGGSNRSCLPRNRESQGMASAHASFTDSDFEAKCEKMSLKLGEPMGGETSLEEHTHTEMPRESHLLPTRLEGLGAASEYFEACLYDMHSPTPYFDCENHVCRPLTLGLGDDVRKVEEIQEPPATRGLALYNTASSVREQKGVAKSQASFKVPTNRFSAAFHEALDPSAKPRPESGVTEIEDLDTTPDVQEAEAAPVVKASQPIPAAQAVASKWLPSNESARIPEESEPFKDAESSLKPSPASLPRAPDKDIPGPEREPGKTAKRYVAVLPPNPGHKTYEEPFSPAPPTPGVQDQRASGGIPLAEVPKVSGRKDGSSPIAPQNTYIANSFCHTSKSPDSSGRTTAADLWPPPRSTQEAKWYEESWKTKENYDLPPRDPKKSQKLVALAACFQRKQKSKKQKGGKKKKKLLIIIAVILSLLIILILVLAMTLTRKRDKMAVQIEWLNITGYPPVPTGISTIAQPDAVHEESGCVQPTTMWSCALPKEGQQGIAPNAPNQPNFRVEIRFQNGTNVGMTNVSKPNARSLAVANPKSTRSFIRTKLLHVRSTFDSALYTPSPAPPSQEDQSFLGNTTDDVHSPFNGEDTPFFITFQSQAPLSSLLLKRQDSSSNNNDRNTNGNSSDPFPDLTKSIPAPSINPDGTASPALLYPYPSAQPLRLYDRGLPSEHYGFYTYFDRSIFLKSTVPLNSSSITGNEGNSVPDDEDGGADENAAGVRCTWAQTRFLVKIWTNKGKPYPLLQGHSTDHTHTSSSSNGGNATNLKRSSADDFSRPGSFPYPISITLDRHGGDVDKKMIYCYGLDAYEKPIPSSKKVQLEDRASNGQLVNPALGPFGKVNVATKDGGPGGIDGGTGGCDCVWQNWK
ncbi:MAG: hypothetical protein Q9217_001134 [Psora testacea]